MERQKIIQTITDVFRDVLDAPQLVLNEGSTSSDVEGWDSLHHIQLVVSVEKAFKIRLSIQEIQQWESVGDMVAGIAARLDARGGGERPLAGEGREIRQQAYFKDPRQVLPLLIEGSPDINLASWVRENKEAVEDGLIRHGGILFRGFPVYTIKEFDEFMKCWNTEPLPYMFRSSPRKELDEKVKNIYQSTIYPADRNIVLHNESSYSRVWGMKIAFCCIQPAEEGGETPLADSRQVLRDIDPELVEKFRAKGVKYRRNLSRGLGMPWTEVFQTEDRKEVAHICKKNGIDFQFNGDDVVIEWSKPAVYEHPVSGEATWFNHVLFFHKFSRFEELDLGPDDLLPPEYLSSESFYGDGTEIGYEEYLNIRQAFQRNTVAIPYRKGDIFLLDNMLTAHGRNPYKGERIIATATIEPAYDAAYSL